MTTRDAPKPPPKLPRSADDPGQSRRFIDMAREVEADESPDALDRAFGKVVGRQKPESEPKKQKKPDKSRG
jgi:hypothetical protein